MKSTTQKEISSHHSANFVTLALQNVMKGTNCMKVASVNQLIQQSSHQHNKIGPLRCCFII